MGDPFEGLFDSGAVLDRVGVDLTVQARRGDLEPVRCRDAEIARVVDILLRHSKNNPALIGKAGVGKTAIVEGLAQRIAGGDVPPALKDARLVALDHRSEEHTSELQSPCNLVCRLLLEKKKKKNYQQDRHIKLQSTTCNQDKAQYYITDLV